MVRHIGAVVAGLLVVFGFVLLLQTVSTQMYPLPEGIDPMDLADAEAFEDYLADLPLTGWGIAFASELVAGFLGALAAGMIARDRKTVFAGVIVLLALGGSVSNWIAFPHPAWFMVGQAIGYALVLLLVRRFLQSVSQA